MNPIQLQNQLTMSSREIAELTGKRHADVMRDIRNMTEELQSANLRFVCNSTSYIAENGQHYPMYELDRDTTDTLLTGYSAVARMKVIKRWRELENQQPKLPNAKELALMVIQAEEEKERLAQENQKQAEIIEAQAPKVAFVDKFVDGSKLYSITEASKILNFKRKDFIECLTRDKYLYRTGGVLVPYETPKYKKLFDVKTGVSEWGRNFTQTKITAQGLNYFSDIYSTELMEVA